MATITMPQLGETVTEGTVARWLKSVGDSIEKYEAFVEVSTDKVNAEVPSPVSGVLREIVVAEGDTVPTGATIAVIEEVGAAAATNGATPANGTANGSPASPVPSSYGAAADPAATVAAAAYLGNGSTPPTGGPATAVERPRTLSPAVRRLVREHNVDVDAVRGTGTGGRITAQDVLAAVANGATAVAAGSRTAVAQPSLAPAAAAQAAIAVPATPTVAPPLAPITTPAPASAPATSGAPGGRSSYEAPVPGTLVPLTPARKVIAQRMVESLSTAPHAWTMVEVDVTSLWAWRNQEKERFQRDKGYGLTLLPFFISAVVQGLRAYPLLNSRFTADGILVERDINISVAVGLDGNLMVPVIRNADQYSISGLAVAAGKLIERARSGKLGADDMAGGTFTVNNTGANGSLASKPIINGGQAAIVTMEAVVKRPVVVNDAIAIRQMMNVCLSLDHRVLDGTSANAFLSDLKTRLQAMKPGGTL